MLRHPSVPISRYLSFLVALSLFWVTAITALATQQDIPAPSGAGTNYAKVVVLPNGNIVVADPSYTAPGSGGLQEQGAVFLLRGTDLTLISTLLGNYSNFHCGKAVTVLPNGNFVVTSTNTSNFNYSTLTWCSGVTGLNATVSESNSQAGYDLKGITVLSTGNYLARWGGFNLNQGFVSFGSGTSGGTGLVSSANSIAGGSSGDDIGDGGIVELTNGNYVIVSLHAYLDTGAVTFCTPTAHSGVVSYQNSLYGKYQEHVGSDGITPLVFPLTNGNYVVCSPRWSRSENDRDGFGAVTFCDGVHGTVGEVSFLNSFIGRMNGDHLGSGGAVALANGNYVVCSPEADDLEHGLANAGALTWASGTTALTGSIAGTNSLYGDTYGGLGSNVTALTDGNYVVAERNWNNSKGAVLWMNGTTAASGVFSAANALVGSVSGDFVGSGQVLALPNGHYVVCSPAWSNGANGQVGAVTWMTGGGAVAGTVSTANSLYGSTANDQIGSGGITVLPNGNYVVCSPLWQVGGAANAGAVTWGDGTDVTAEPVSAANSIVGSSANDNVGQQAPIILSNGNYVVATPTWDNGSVVNAGAVTWGSGTGPTAAVISASKSLVGATADDQVGNGGVAVLTNGNYAVRSPTWDNGAMVDAGALTWGDGTTGTAGVISAANSLVGSTANDDVGENLVSLANGDGLALSRQWDNGAIVDAGAVTYFKGDGTTVGLITSANSFRGTITYDVTSAAFDPTGNRTFIGRSSKFLTIFTPSLPNSAPTDIALSNASIAENNAVNATIGTLSATDADAGQTQTFTLVAGPGSTDNASFQITGTTLKIKIATDFETKNSYSIRVRATDNGDPVASFEKALTITITDVPENAAPTNIVLSNSTLAEGNAAGTTVGTLSAVDADAGQTHGFTLVSGAGSMDNAAFTISGDLLEINSVADFETKNSYSVRIRTTDNGTPVKIFEKAFTITITDAPENAAPTDITLSNSILAENNLPGASVGTLSATDPDAGQTQGFTLVSGAGSTDNAAFTISSDRTGSVLKLNGVADFETKSSYSVRIRATDDGTPVQTFEKVFTITIADVLEGPRGVNDVVTTGSGESVIYPLANDVNRNTTIVSVKTHAVNIFADGRALLIPADFTGTFDYVTADGNVGSVTVSAGAPLGTASQFNGLLRDNSDRVVGWATVTFNARGSVTTKAMLGGTVVAKNFFFGKGNTSSTVAARFGTITLQRSADGTVYYGISTTGGAFGGTLRPLRPVATAEKHHIVLASIDPAIPGAGLLTATISKNGRVALKGTLPDGRPFSAGSAVSDNGSLAFYAREAVKPAGTVGGELVLADLPDTDATGELSWFKPQQSPNVRGLHLGGVDTILTANSSIYRGTLPTGATGTLHLTGGNLAADESSTVSLVAGKPVAPANSLVSWGPVSPATGKFAPKIRLPNVARPVSGAGLYFSKSKTAWAFFPGTTIGGRIELTVP